jgi:hypothetical protein
MQVVRITLTAVDGLGNTVDFPLTVRVNPGQPVLKGSIPDIAVAQDETLQFQMEPGKFEMNSPAGSFILRSELVIRQVRVLLIAEYNVACRAQDERCCLMMSFLTYFPPPPFAPLILLLYRTYI